MPPYKEPIVRRKPRPRPKPRARPRPTGVFVHPIGTVGVGKHQQRAAAKKTRRAKARIPAAPVPYVPKLKHYTPKQRRVAAHLYNRAAKRAGGGSVKVGTDAGGKPIRLPRNTREQARAILRDQRTKGGQARVALLDKIMRQRSMLNQRARDAESFYAEGSGLHTFGGTRSVVADPRTAAQAERSRLKARAAVPDTTETHGGHLKIGTLDVSPIQKASELPVIKQSVTASTLLRNVPNRLFVQTPKALIEHPSDGSTATSGKRSSTRSRGSSPPTARTLPSPSSPVAASGSSRSTRRPATRACRRKPRRSTS
jgi:hypothetical protein